jgi:predicted DNA-binding transcriptional regulator AlpA
MSDRLAVLGLTEVATLLGVSKRTASRYASRDDFPAPAADLAMGPIWFESDVRSWLETKPIRRGRPPRAAEFGD